MNRPSTERTWTRAATLSPVLLSTILPAIFGMPAFRSSDISDRARCDCTGDLQHHRAVGLSASLYSQCKRSFDFIQGPREFCDSATADEYANVGVLAKRANQQ